MHQGNKSKRLQEEKRSLKAELLTLRIKRNQRDGTPLDHLVVKAMAR